MALNDPTELLRRADRYLHAVPLSGARAHEVGKFTLFRSTTAWSYYARPRPTPATNATNTKVPQTNAPTNNVPTNNVPPNIVMTDDVTTDDGTTDLFTTDDGTEHLFTVEDVECLRIRCRELGLPLSLEWVHESAPSLAGAAVAAGLDVVEHPLLALRSEAFVPAAAPTGVTVEIAAANRQTLVTARAVADVAFGAPGTQVGESGVEARDGRKPAVGVARANALVERTRRRVTVTAVALGPDGQPVASGQHQPVGSCSEIVAVATLPAFRRRGLASAVTSALVQNAFENGVDLVLLMAQNDDVARIYERLGFRTIGTVGAAEARGAKP